MVRGVSRGERLMMAVVVILTGCSGGGSVTATTPSSTATSSPATTTTVSDPGSTTTTGTADDRLAEIEAIFQDLEQRRLTALYEGDREAFAALFANEEYLARSLAVFDQAEFTGPPEVVQPMVTSVLFDGESCIAIRVTVDYSAFVSGATQSIGDYVLELMDEAWGFSYAGEGWQCVGPHPLQP
jgi:hypothetical protein